MNKKLELKIEFVPETEDFIDATKEYQDIWDNEGSKMLDAFVSVSGLEFMKKKRWAVVYEGASGAFPLALRASYPNEVNKATLIHELCHILFQENNIKVRRDSQQLEGHKAIDLILFDIWVNLYGEEFAIRNVEIESKRKGLADYESAWKWALAMSRDERKEKFQELINQL